jgi:hypothetical protein
VNSRRYWLGADLGQASDYTALAVVERVKPPGDELEPDPTRMVIRQPGDRTGPAVARVMRPKLVNHFRVPHLERIPLGTPYPAQVARIKALMTTPPLQGYCELVVDATGCGRPVVDLLREAGLRPVAVVITAGDEATSEGFYWHVPKKDLIGGLEVAFQGKRLAIAESLPEAETLRAELLSYQRRITPAAHVQYGEWRVGKHDDILLAVALGVWRAQRVREIRSW